MLKQEEIEKKADITELFKVADIDTSNLITYVMLMSICVDGYFEGIAIGASNHTDQILLLAFAILVNKLILGLLLGISLKKANIEKTTFVKFIIVFASFTPLGIMSGMIISHNILFRGIMLSVSAGSYIYVSTSVVVIEEFTIKLHKFRKYIFFILGGLLSGGMLFCSNL